MYKQIKERVLEQIKADKDRIAEEVADTLRQNIVDKLVEYMPLDEIAEELQINSSDIASYVDCESVAEKIAEDLDIRDLAAEVETDYREIAKKIEKEINYDDFVTSDIIDEVQEKIRQSIVKEVMEIIVEE